jgi:hypothetical protein
MPKLTGGGGGTAGVCTPGPYTAVGFYDTTVPATAWLGAWADSTGTVQANLGLDATTGLDVQTVETEVACGTGTYLPAIVGTVTGESPNFAYESTWTATVPRACVSTPPAAPTYAPFTDNQTKSLYIPNAQVYLTLYTYMCQGGGPTTPQYAVRYTRDGNTTQVYADYMLSAQAPLQ